MKKPFILILSFVFSTVFSQQNAYYQQFAKYKMDIDVDAANFTYQGKQTLNLSLIHI